MKAYRFKIPLRQPILLKGESYSTRKGILLEQNGRWAEASPLPGFSAETIDDVVRELLRQQVPGTQRCQSLEFAYSMLNSDFKSGTSVPFNGLLMGDLATIMASLDSCLALKSRAVKLKVGRHELDQEIALVQRICQRLPNEVSLRLDANQAWEFDEAAKFVRAFPKPPWEYIEEPLRDAHQLETLYQQTGVRYALDETLLGEPDLSIWPNAATLICKPTILGGRTAVERLAATGKPVVFSSAFESGVGVARIMQLASEFSPQIPAGLDTLDWLSNDLLVGSPEKRNGELFLDSLLVDTADLEPIR